MTKIKLKCVNCGKEIKLDFHSITALCKKCQRMNNKKTIIMDDYFLSDS